MMKSNSLLEVQHLTTQFHTLSGSVTAVDDVSLSLKQGEVLGIVGESGCGKSVTALSIMRLFGEDSGTTTDGSIYFDGLDLLNIPEKQMENMRGSQISMIFQDPMSSLNPVFTIGDQIMEPLIIHQKLSKKAARIKAIDMLRLVGIPNPEIRINEYPHQLSGGMRQRVMIAIGLSCRPKLLIADEPTTALDVTIQAQILKLMTDLIDKMGMALILITHDLGVVAETCNRVIVMYLGEIVEELDVEELYISPKHPYTIGLLKSMPSMQTSRNKKLEAIEGTVPSLANVPVGCRFSDRCKWVEESCLTTHPILQEVGERHYVRCWKHDQIDYNPGGENNDVNS